MSLVRQLVITLLVLIGGLCGWVYFFPGAINTLAEHNLDIAPLRQIAALNTSLSGGTGAPEGGGRQRGGRQALVIAEPVGKAVINDRLTAIGNGRAVQSVTVTPLVSGQIVELVAEPGQLIAQGDVIARLDAKSEALALEKARLTADDLRIRAERTQSLFDKGSTTATALESAQSELATAELAVREAQLNLDRRTIPAPIRGVVGIVAASLGEFVTNQSEIVTIDNRETIIIEFFVPERFATAIELGAPVSASSVARPGGTFSGKVVAIDNRVDVASRTLRIRAEIENSQDKLRAGMAFNVTMRFDGDTFPAVDPLAVQWDADGSYVWLIDQEGKARKVNARIVQRNPESVLVEADLREGDLVVTEGVQNVREGAEVAFPDDRNPGNKVSEPAAGSSTTSKS